MIQELKHYRFPEALIEEQKRNQITRDLFFTEIGEISVEKDSLWRSSGKLNQNMLIFCIKGNGILAIAGEQLPLKEYQFIIIPKKEEFKFYSDIEKSSRFLYFHFAGKKAELFANHYAVIRSLISSVNNLVANREMLFEEIFNNLAKGFHNQNLEYVNLCFGHLLGTFIYAHKTGDELADESNPGIRRSIDFMNKNLDKKLTLKQLSEEAGYSPTYFTTLFRNETNYAPLSYFSHLKILKACEYLDYTKTKIKEISFHLGYSDPYYFTKDFKKKMGLSPRQYRNRIS